MRSAWNPAALGLVALMALGSVLMWIGVPLGLIYLASMLADTPNPSMGPYLLVLIGLPVGMAVIGKALGALNRAHIRVTGAEVDAYRPGWTRSMRGERKVEVPHGYSEHRRERSAVSFAKSFQLPARVDADKVTAILKHGVLTLTLPKAAEAQPRQISVNAA